MRDKYYILTLIILIVFLYLKCESHNKEINDLQAIHKREKAAFNISITEKDIKIGTQKINLVRSRSKVKSLIDEVKGLRKPHTQVITKVVTIIKEVEAKPLHDVDLKIDTASGKASLLLPQSFGASNEFYSINYTVRDDGLSFIDSASFTAYPKITLGYADKGKLGNLFKKREPIVAFEMGNPYSNIVEMNNIVHDKPKNRGVKVAAITFSFISEAYLNK